jgi:hypothetical protein
MNSDSDSDIDMDIVPNSILKRTKSSKMIRKYNINQVGINVRSPRTKRTSKKNPKKSPSKHPDSLGKIDLKGNKKINRFCNSDIEECLQINLRNLKYIGGGTFGSLFKAVDPSGHNIALKLIIGVDDDDFSPKTKLEKYSSMKKELDLTTLMGEHDIGPKVIDTINFLIQSNEVSDYKVISQMLSTIEITYKTKYNEVYPQFFALSKPGNFCNRDPNLRSCHIISIQIIVMDAYDMDCHMALKDHKISDVIKLQIVHDMVILMYRQIFELHIYCYDIKPGNFVVNLPAKKTRSASRSTSPSSTFSQGRFAVKMIDFGVDFCKEKKDNIYTGIHNSKPIFGDFSSQEILFFSNVLQIFLYLYTNDFFKDMNDNLKKQYFNILFNNKICTKMLHGRWDIFIKSYLDHAKKNADNLDRDPSNNLVWYGGFQEIFDEKGPKIVAKEIIEIIKTFGILLL